MSSPDRTMPLRRSAFAPRVVGADAGAASAGAVTMTEIERQMVTVQARRGGRITLDGLPPPGRSAGMGGMVGYAIAPETWLLAAPASDRGFAQRIASMVGSTGAVVDQSHGKAYLRVGGARVGDVLDKVCRLDLHPSAFAPGACGITEIAHTAVLIARADEGGAGVAATFDLIIPSTFAVHVLEAVETAAAEFMARA